MRRRPEQAHGSMLRPRSCWRARNGLSRAELTTLRQLLNEGLAVFEAAFNHFYAGAGVTSVRLPSEPAAEIAMSTGVRPKIGNIDLDLGWTYYLYPSGGTPPVGTMADINYWEFVARADTSVGELAYRLIIRTPAHGATTLHLVSASTCCANCGCVTSLWQSPAVLAISGLAINRPRWGAFHCRTSCRV